MITLTPRGYAFKGSSSATLVSDTFTPAANSLLFLVHYTDYISGSGDGCIESISGHGAWSLVFQFVFGGLAIEVWGCLVGGSPGSAQIVATNGYVWRSECEFFEAGGDVDRSGGTVASCFGVNASGSEYFTGSDQTLNLTLPAFANASGLTFVVGAGNIVNSMGAGYTLHTQRNSSGWFLRTGYLAAEDNSIEIVGGAWTTVRGAAFEIKGTSGGGTTTHDLATAATGSLQATAALAVSKALASGAIAGASASASIVHGVPLALAATGGAGAAADLSVQGSASLAMAAVAGATATGALALTVPLATSATAGAAAQAALSRTATLMGAATVSGTASAAMSHGVPLSAVAIAGANAQGQLVLGIALQTAAQVGAQASANLSAFGGAALATAAVVGAQASAALSLDVRLATQAVGGATAAVNFGVVVPLSTAAIAQAQATGTLEVVLVLGTQATAGASASASPQLTVLLGTSAVAGAYATAGFADSALLSVPGYIATAHPRRLAATARRRQYTARA